MSDEAVLAQAAANCVADPFACSFGFWFGKGIAGLLTFLLGVAAIIAPFGVAFAVACWLDRRARKRQAEASDEFEREG